MATTKQATLYRMVMPTHICPYGLKAKDLLQRKGYAVDDRWLRTREETDAFKAEHDVKTTPQVFIDGARIGGYDDLRRFFGITVLDKDTPRYRPVVVVFVVAALIAVAIGLSTDTLVLSTTLMRFGATSMCLLAMLKLQDIEQFSTMFLNYDLLARRFVPYASAYPWLELTAGVLMLSASFHLIAIPIALVIGGIGAVSVFKAVYVDKRELKCACVGGGSAVPLGFVSLTENLVMLAMAVAMAVDFFNNLPG